MNLDEVWALDINRQDGAVKLVSSGMTILTSSKGRISVGYSQEQRLENFRLISASPEMFKILKLAERIINADNPRQWEITDFNNGLKLIENKVAGGGKIQIPNHCRATYEWTDEHIEKYHNKVKELKYKL